MKPGFSLIEIIIATAISAILSLILYNAFSQTNRLVQRVRSLMEDTSDTLSSYAQLEKDFSAIFRPIFEEIKKATPPPAQPPAAGQAQTPPPAPKKETPKQKKPDIVPFKTTKEGDKLSAISFVTTNAFSILNEATPRPVRVTYKFKSQEGAQKKLYTLVREEAPYDQKAESSDGGKTSSPAKPAHAYALVRNIKTFSAKFSAYDCQEDSKELVSLSEWGTDEQKKKCPKHTIPQFVEITWDVVDLMTEREHSYTVAVSIPAANCPELIEPESTQLPAQATTQQQQQKIGAASQPTAQQAPAAQGQKTNSFRLMLGGGAKT